MNDEKLSDFQNDSLKLENQLCFPLYAAARKVVNLYTPLLKPLGITYTQYIVFLALWEQDEMTVGELGKKLHLDNGTLTPLLKKLETMGYVNRARSAQDERVVIVTLTPEGHAFQEKVKEIPGKVARCVPLSHDDSIVLYHLLYKLLSDLIRRCPDP